MSTYVDINFHDETELRMVLKTVRDVERLEAAIRALFVPVDPDTDKPSSCPQPNEKGLKHDEPLAEWARRIEITRKGDKDWYGVFPQLKSVSPNVSCLMYYPSHKTINFGLTEAELKDIRDRKSTLNINWRFKDRTLVTKPQNVEQDKEAKLAEFLKEVILVPTDGAKMVGPNFYFKSYERSSFSGLHVYSFESEKGQPIQFEYDIVNDILNDVSQYFSFIPKPNEEPTKDVYLAEWLKTQYLYSTNLLSRYEFESMISDSVYGYYYHFKNSTDKGLEFTYEMIQDIINGKNEFWIFKPKSKEA